MISALRLQFFYFPALLPVIRSQHSYLYSMLRPDFYSKESPPTNKLYRMVRVQDASVWAASLPILATHVFPNKSYSTSLGAGSHLQLTYCNPTIPDQYGTLLGVYAVEYRFVVFLIRLDHWVGEAARNTISYIALPHHLVRMSLWWEIHYRLNRNQLSRVLYSRYLTSNSDLQDPLDAIYLPLTGLASSRHVVKERWWKRNWGQMTRREV